jgi:hypothetical protein
MSIENYGHWSCDFLSPLFSKAGIMEVICTFLIYKIKYVLSMQRSQKVNFSVKYGKNSNKYELGAAWQCKYCSAVSVLVI